MECRCIEFHYETTLSGKGQGIGTLQKSPQKTQKCLQQYIEIL